MEVQGGSSRRMMCPDACWLKFNTTSLQSGRQLRDGAEAANGRKTG